MSRTLTLLCALAAGLLASQPAAAGEWFSGGPNSRDYVTGYLCADPACTVLYLPRSKCICQKINPGETVLARLKLRCSIVNFSRVSACPVLSPYGINVR